MGLHVCFPHKGLPPLLECGFESQLNLEFSGFSTWHFLEPMSKEERRPEYLEKTPNDKNQKMISLSTLACRRQFALGTLISSPPSSVNGPANKTKLK